MRFCCQIQETQQHGVIPITIFYKPARHCTGHEKTQNSILPTTIAHRPRQPCSAGLLSSYGFLYISDFLESKIGLRDTCGVHNLHGMPGLLGGLVPILALTSCCEHSAAHAQVLAVICTLFIAVAGGIGSAYLVKLIPTETGAELENLTFEDATIFADVEEEK